MAEEQLGRYRILEEIAAGSQGIVYRAFDPDSSRIVAIKVLHSNFAADENYLRRFQREATITASIDHPNIVQIFEVGEDSGRHFMVMELLPESLDNLIQAGLPTASASKLVAQIADGLQVAHQAGIVHRDIKPQNILIGSDGMPKVTDFGIARSELMSVMTVTGVLMGTPFYMSPEQARGDALDLRSDVYSLGCLFYQLLTGALPFNASSPLVVLRLHIENEPPPIRDLRADIQNDVIEIVERAMEKNPNRRFQSMEEMADAIRHVIPMESAAVAQIRPTVSSIPPMQTSIDPTVIARDAPNRPQGGSNAASDFVSQPEILAPDQSFPAGQSSSVPFNSLVVDVIAGDGTAGFVGDNGPALASRLHEPRDIAVGVDGAAYIADTRNHRIRRVDPQTGDISTVAGIGTPGFSGDGGAAVLAQLNGPQGICVANDGTFYISDTENNRIRRVDPRSGAINTVVGNGERFYTEHSGPATELNIGQPIGISISSNGRFLFVVGTGGPIVEIRGIRNDRPHAVHIVDIPSNRLWKIAGMTGNPGFSPDGTSARLANLNHPRSVAVDSDGHVYIADLGNNRVRKIDRVNLAISTVAGNGDAGSADGMDGRMALTVPLTPLAVTVGPDGAIMILEQTGDRIRQVDGAGRISTIFAGYDAPYSGGSPASSARTKIRGLTVDNRGHLWFVDAGNHVAQFIKSSS